MVRWMDDVSKFRRELLKRLDIYLWSEGQLHSAGQTVGQDSEVYVDIIARLSVKMCQNLFAVAFTEREWEGMKVYGGPEMWDILHTIIVGQLMLTELHEILHQHAPLVREDEIVEQMAQVCIQYVNSIKPPDRKTAFLGDERD